MFANEFQEIEIRTAVEASNNICALGIALEKIVDANLHFKVNPFVALDDSSLHGDTVCTLLQMRPKLRAENVRCFLCVIFILCLCMNRCKRRRRDVGLLDYRHQGVGAVS